MVQFGFEGYVDKTFLVARQAIPPIDPSTAPGKIIINGRLNTSCNPPLPRMADIVCGSCQTRSKIAAPETLMIAATLAVTTPDMAPAVNDPDRHAPEKPAANKIPAPRKVDTSARA